MENQIGLNFHLRDKLGYAYRTWPQVPAVGDVVMLHDPEREADTRYPAIVRLVVWAIREESWAGKLLECDVYIEWQDEVLIPWHPA